MAIDDKNAIPHAGKPTKKVRLIFENGSTIELTEKNDEEEWKGVIGMIIEEWLSIEEVRKLYPDMKFE